MAAKECIAPTSPAPLPPIPLIAKSPRRDNSGAFNPTRLVFGGRIDQHKLDREKDTIRAKLPALGCLKFETTSSFTKDEVVKNFFDLLGSPVLRDKKEIECEEDYITPLRCRPAEVLLFNLANVTESQFAELIKGLSRLDFSRLELFDFGSFLSESQTMSIAAFAASRAPRLRRFRITENFIDSGSPIFYSALRQILLNGVSEIIFRNCSVSGADLLRPLLLNICHKTFLRRLDGISLKQALPSQHLLLAGEAEFTNEELLSQACLLTVPEWLFGGGCSYTWQDLSQAKPHTFKHAVLAAYKIQKYRNEKVQNLDKKDRLEGKNEREDSISNSFQSACVEEGHYQAFCRKDQGEASDDQNILDTLSLTDVSALGGLDCMNFGPDDVDRQLNKITVSKNTISLLESTLSGREVILTWTRARTEMYWLFEVIDVLIHKKNHVVGFRPIVKVWMPPAQGGVLGGFFCYAELLTRYGSNVSVRYLSEVDVANAAQQMRVLKRIEDAKNQLTEYSDRCDHGNVPMDKEKEIEKAEKLELTSATTPSTRQDCGSSADAAHKKDPSLSSPPTIDIGDHTIEFEEANKCSSDLTLPTLRLPTEIGIRSDAGGNSRKSHMKTPVVEKAKRERSARIANDSVTTRGRTRPMCKAVNGNGLHAVAVLPTISSVDFVSIRRVELVRVDDLDSKYGFLDHKFSDGDWVEFDVRFSRRTKKSSRVKRSAVGYVISVEEVLAISAFDEVHDDASPSVPGLKPILSGLKTSKVVSKSNKIAQKTSFIHSPARHHSSADLCMWKFVVCPFSYGKSSVDSSVCVSNIASPMVSSNTSARVSESESPFFPSLDDSPLSPSPTIEEARNLDTLQQFPICINRDVCKLPMIFQVPISQMRPYTPVHCPDNWSIQSLLIAHHEASAENGLPDAAYCLPDHYGVDESDWNLFGGKLFRPEGIMSSELRLQFATLQNYPSSPHIGVQCQMKCQAQPLWAQKRSMEKNPPREILGGLGSEERPEDQKMPKSVKVKENHTRLDESYTHEKKSNVAEPIQDEHNGRRPLSTNSKPSKTISKAKGCKSPAKSEVEPSKVEMLKKSYETCEFNQPIEQFYMEGSKKAAVLDEEGAEGTSKSGPPLAATLVLVDKLVENGKLYSEDENGDIHMTGSCSSDTFVASNSDSDIKVGHERPSSAKHARGKGRPRKPKIGDLEVDDEGLLAMDTNSHKSAARKVAHPSGMTTTAGSSHDTVAQDSSENIRRECHPSKSLPFTIKSLLGFDVPEEKLSFLHTPISTNEKNRISRRRSRRSFRYISTNEVEDKTASDCSTDESSETDDFCKETSSYLQVTEESRFKETENIKEQTGTGCQATHSLLGTPNVVSRDTPTSTWDCRGGCDASMQPAHRVAEVFGVNDYLASAINQSRISSEYKSENPHFAALEGPMAEPMSFNKVKELWKSITWDDPRSYDLSRELEAIVNSAAFDRETRRRRAFDWLKEQELSFWNFVDQLKVSDCVFDSLFEVQPERLLQLVERIPVILFERLQKEGLSCHLCRSRGKQSIHKSEKKVSTTGFPFRQFNSIGSNSKISGALDNSKALDAFENFPEQSFWQAITAPWIEDNVVLEQIDLILLLAKGAGLLDGKVEEEFWIDHSQQIRLLDFIHVCRQLKESIICTRQRLLDPICLEEKKCTEGGKVMDRQALLRNELSQEFEYTKNDIRPSNEESINKLDSNRALGCNHWRLSPNLYRESDADSDGSVNKGENDVSATILRHLSRVAIKLGLSPLAVPKSLDKNLYRISHTLGRRIAATQQLTDQDPELKKLRQNFLKQKLGQEAEAYRSILNSWRMQQQHTSRLFCDSSLEPPERPTTKLSRKKSAVKGLKTTVRVAGDELHEFLGEVQGSQIKSEKMVESSPNLIREQNNYTRSKRTAARNSFNAASPPTKMQTRYASFNPNPDEEDDTSDRKSARDSTQHWKSVPNRKRPVPTTDNSSMRLSSTDILAGLDTETRPIEASAPMTKKSRTASRRRRPMEWSDSRQQIYVSSAQTDNENLKSGDAQNGQKVMPNAKAVLRRGCLMAAQVRPKGENSATLRHDDILKWITGMSPASTAIQTEHQSLAVNDLKKAFQTFQKEQCRRLTGQSDNHSDAIGSPLGLDRGAGSSELRIDKQAAEKLKAILLSTIKTKQQATQQSHLMQLHASSAVAEPNPATLLGLLNKIRARNVPQQSSPAKAESQLSPQSLRQPNEPVPPKTDADSSTIESLIRRRKGDVTFLTAVGQLASRSNNPVVHKVHQLLQQHNLPLTNVHSTTNPQCSSSSINSNTFQSGTHFESQDLLRSKPVQLERALLDVLRTQQ